MEDTNIREIPEKENLKKVVNIVRKILNFNEQQKGNQLKGIKIIVPKQMLQRLPIALAHVTFCNIIKLFK